MLHAMMKIIRSGEFIQQNNFLAQWSPVRLSSHGGLSQPDGICV
jgi:hypothetical protein